MKVLLLAVIVAAVSCYPDVPQHERERAVGDDCRTSFDCQLCQHHQHATCNLAHGHGKCDACPLRDGECFTAADCTVHCHGHQHKTCDGETAHHPGKCVCTN